MSCRQFLTLQKSNYLVLDMSSFGLDNCLNPSRHTFYPFLTLFHRNIPCHIHKIMLSATLDLCSHVHQLWSTLAQIAVRTLQSSLYILLHYVPCVTFCPYSFVSWTYLFFSHDYSSVPCHQPANSTSLHNHFLLSASSGFYDSFLLTHMYFFMIPLHFTMFHLLCHCSGLSQVSGI